MDTATIIRNVSREAELDEDTAGSAVTATPAAERAASAVLRVVGEAVEPAAWSDVLAQLPTTTETPPTPACDW